MNFIKKIFDKKFDNSVHLQFQKFSRGEFRDRALIEIKKVGEKFTIKTSSEFANELVFMCAEKLGQNKTKVTGAIISTSDLTGEIDFKEKKQFQGVKRYLIEKEMSGNEIVSLVNKFPKNFFALSFETGENILKIKPKAPKSGKPGKEKEDGPKAEFCTLKTTDKKIAEDFVFEKPSFKQAEVNHTFFIEEIVPPKDEKDFAKMREMAVRKGKIVRKTKIDGELLVKEMKFEA